jgi:hypothetical protein
MIPRASRRRSGIGRQKTRGETAYALTRGCRRAGVRSVAGGCVFPSPPPHPGLSELSRSVFAVSAADQRRTAERVGGGSRAMGGPPGPAVVVNEQQGQADGCQSEQILLSSPSLPARRGRTNRQRAADLGSAHLPLYPASGRAASAGEDCPLSVVRLPTSRRRDSLPPLISASVR